MKKCLVYLAIPMTGYDKRDMVKLSRHALKVLKKHGLEGWSPVIKERVKSEHGVLTNTGNRLLPKWRMDKGALRKCDVFLNLRGDEKSFGCEREFMLMRGSYFKPAVVVSPRHANGYFSIANYEDDALVGTIEEAALLIADRWGTFPKRFFWRLNIYNRCLPKFIFTHLFGLFS